MKKIIICLLITSVVAIAGCIDPSGNSGDTIGAFNSDVNLNANFYMIGAKTAVIENRSARVGEILLVENGIRTSSLRIDSVRGVNAVLSDAPISEVFNELEIQDTYPLVDAEEVDEVPEGSRASAITV